MNLPNDPIMLMSVVNTKLRDEFESPDELCKAYSINREELDKKLKAAGFTYKPETNQYR